MVEDNNIRIKISTAFEKAGLRQAETELKKLATGVGVPNQIKQLQKMKVPDYYDSQAQAVKNFQNEMQGMDVMPVHGVKSLEEGAEKAGISMGRLQNRLNKFNLELIDSGDGSKMLKNRLTGDFMSIGKGVEMAQKDLRQFKMEWLSIIFFSMAMQKSLSNIMTSSVRTFMQIAGETNMANQSLAAFGAQVTFVKFALGQALGEALIPFIPIFAEFVQGIVDFIDQNPELVAWGLVGAFTAFFALFTTAQIVLVTDGLITILTKIGLIGTAATTTTGSVATMNGTLAATGKIGLGGLLAGFATFLMYAIAVAGALAVVLYTLGKIRNMFKEAEAYDNLMKGQKEIDYKLPYQSRGTRVSTGQPDLTQLQEFTVPMEDVIRSTDEYYNSLDKTQIKIGELSSTGRDSLMNIGLETTELTNLIGSNNGGEYSLINSLDLASNEWMNMGEISTGEIDRIIVSLNSIPKEVVTKHVIIEERRSSSQSSGNPISNLLRGRV